MKISNIFLIICLIFIVAVFFISPSLIKKIPYQNFGEGLFIGTVIKEPEIKNSNTKLTIKTENEKILVTTGNYPQYFYGDVLKVQGELEEPKIFDEFDYKNYLAKEGIYLVAYWPEIEILERDKGNPIFGAILKFKNKTTNSIEKIMPFPEASLLEGIILGNKQIFSEDLKNSLNITGTSHIVAISGMNIVIISEILMFVLIAMGLWRKHAFWFVLVLIFLFIIMVGAPASAVRAGIMGAILLYAQKIGRISNAARIMVFAAAIMLIFNPLLLRYDVGFQLSFLAVFGLIYIKPVFDELILKKIKKEELNGLLQIVTTTLAAQIAVLPVLIYNFGRISFISPLTNILIVPFIPFLTAIGLIFIGGTIIWGFLGKILLWPVYLGVTYVLKIIDWFSKIPWAAKEIQNIHWLFLIGYYILLIGLIWLFKRSKRLAF
ncbi:MAG: ComEC/Rec2 family competence protein [bacterium]|nr:ComEC/Rec2 family competence protein [bacterium]